MLNWSCPNISQPNLMMILFYCWAHIPNQGVGRCYMQHQNPTSNVKIGVGINKLTCL